MASAASSPLRKTATLFSRQKKAFLVTAVAPQTRVELSSQRASSPSSVQTSVLFCAQPCFLINGQRLLHSSPIARLTGKESSGDDPGTKQETDQNKSNKGLGAEPLESGDTIQVNPSQPVKVYSLKVSEQLKSICSYVS